MNAARFISLICSKNRQPSIKDIAEEKGEMIGMDENSFMFFFLIKRDLKFLKHIL